MTSGNSGGIFRRGLFPELALSSATRPAPDLFSAIVIDGVRAQNGMAAYAGVFDADGAEAIRSYLIAEASAAAGQQR